MPTATSQLRLLEPGLEMLPDYTDALARGWSPNTMRDVSAEHLEAIRKDPEAFIASQLSQSGSIRLPDGSTIPRLPNRVRWISDDDGFAGQISLRWQPGTDALPDYVLGHIGFAVVPWKRHRGYATHALGQMLAEASAVGLRRIEITADPDNVASQRVIEANGGRLAGQFVNLRFGPAPKLRYVVDLP